MKKILGLDLGTTSIGWAFVKEDEKRAKSHIVATGVRVIPLSTDEKNDFKKGNAISVNADRTLKRCARRNNQRFKQRRSNLLNLLQEYGLLKSTDSLTEEGKNSTHKLIKLRAKACKEKISLQDFSRVLLSINKKRGYKSSRKANNQEEGQLIDGMAIAKELDNINMTTGQYSYSILESGKNKLPEYYRSDLIHEFKKIWVTQKESHPIILTDEFFKEIIGKTSKATYYKFNTEMGITPVELKGKRKEKKLESYNLRAKAANKQVSIEELAFVLQQINEDINKSSGYLGAISDRSKELFFNDKTVGQFLLEKINENAHQSLKNQIFYRQDYVNEFEKIWSVQSKFHSKLSLNLKKKIQYEIIFYQRRLKSQKHLVSNCELEPQRKAIPKSSPLFQQFKIWQNINNLVFTNKKTKDSINASELDQEIRNLLFENLNLVDNLSSSQVLSFVFEKPKEYELNFKKVEGNRTFHSIVNILNSIIESEGYEINYKKNTLVELKHFISDFCDKLNIDLKILTLDSSINENQFDKQQSMQFWHLIYSYEDDSSNTGIEKLNQKLNSKFGIPKEYCTRFSNLSLQDNYGSLSSKAIRRIIPHLQDGLTYDKACALAGYNHSSSETLEEKEKRILKSKLELIPKNSLRNPVVEKIINQLVNVINAIIEDPKLGVPDEIRIEIARELKANAKQRKDTLAHIEAATKKHIKIREILKSEFGFKYINRNDVIKYKLYQELGPIAYKCPYCSNPISKQDLVKANVDIEHIIPKSRLFDDSFTNKTLSHRTCNLEKGNLTALNYMETKGEVQLDAYKSRVEELYTKGTIKKTKRDKLLMSADKIPEDFISRDLGNTQFIAKKALMMLREICKEVHPTTGKITDRLRSEWELIDVLKELNWDKYYKIGFTKIIVGKNGQQIRRIKDWTKRNDHRHHAMDAITIAFTKKSIVQYLNNLNAKSDKSSSIYAIEKKELHKTKSNKLVFKPPYNGIREDAKKHLASLLVSHKTKNKVTTRNKNKSKLKGKDNFNTKIELTPRGQLHKETIYGIKKYYETKEVKVNASFDIEMIMQVAKKSHREALLERLSTHANDPKKAFTGKNSLTKNPIYLNNGNKDTIPEKVKLVWLETRFTIRKEINHELKIDKVIDVGIRNILRKRLVDYDNNSKLAFSNLDQNPIWLNQDKGIKIKRVTISGVSNAEPLHHKRDYKGVEILDAQGNPIPTDYVQTGSNHHIAIYKNQNGDFQEEVVSFYEAVARKNAGLPVIKKDHELGWEFLYTMKQNECFVFPSDDLDPSEIDLKDPKYYDLISTHLFRVQKISAGDYTFNHHIETMAVSSDTLKKKELNKGTFYRIRSPKNLNDIIKVRLNHLGRIVHIGEY